MAYTKNLIPKVDIVVDIETVTVPPSKEAVEVAYKEAQDSYAPPGNYKDPEKIEAHKAKFFDGLKSKVANELAEKNKFKINGKRMICCGLGIAKAGEVQNIEAFSGDDLARIMDGIVGYLDKYGEHGYRLVGFNHSKFDWPEVVKSGALTKRYPANRPSKWDVIDLCQKPFWGEKLSDIAAAFGKTKTASGSDVADMYAKGDWKRIEEYCKNDVKITGEIFLICNKWMEL